MKEDSEVTPERDPNKVSERSFGVPKEAQVEDIRDGSFSPKEFTRRGVSCGTKGGRESRGNIDGLIM